MSRKRNISNNLYYPEDEEFEEGYWQKQARNESKAELAPKLNEVRYTIARNIRKMREERGETLEEFGIDVGLTRQTISKFEGGSVMPSLKNLLQICVALDCSFDCLTNNLGYSNHDLKYICEETGLSESAVRILQGYASVNETFIDTINKLIIDSWVTNNSILNLLEQYASPPQQFTAEISNGTKKTVIPLEEVTLTDKFRNSYTEELSTGMIDNNLSPDELMKAKLTIGHGLLDVSVTNEMIKNAILAVIGKKIDEMFAVDNSTAAATSKK